MACPHNKNGYYSEAEVQEALIRSQIRFIRAAKNYYRCIDCNEYHLTSQGLRHPLLNDPEIQERIKKEQQLQDWADRFRKR